MKINIAFACLFSFSAYTGLCQTPGQLKWEFSRLYVTAASPVIGPDGTIYTVDGGSVTPSPPPHCLWAVTPDGVEKWRFPLDYVTENTPAVGSDGTVYVNSGLILYAVTNGASKWTYSLQQGLWVGRIGISPEENIYFGDGNAFVSLNKNGQVNWVYTNAASFDESQFVYACPAIGLDGTIYVNGSFGKFYAFNTNGTVRWILGYPDTGVTPTATSPPAIGADGTIYFGTTGNQTTNTQFIAVNPDGSIKWRYRDAQYTSFRSAAAIGADHSIYVLGNIEADFKSELLAFDQNGGVRWRFTNGIPSYITSLVSSPAVAANGAIYIGGADGKVYAINSNGTLRWESPAIGGYFIASPVIAPDGTIYIADRSTVSLFAINGDASPACSFWPQFGKNARRSGSTSPTSLSNPSKGVVGEFGFMITGVTGIVCNVCATTNLNQGQWEKIGEVSVSNPTNFVDVQASNYVQRFYRLTEQ